MLLQRNMHQRTHQQRAAVRTPRVRPHRPNEPDLSIFRRHGYDWVNHRVADIPGAFDNDKIVIGLDWYKTCTPLLQNGSFWAPTPLVVQQLRDSLGHGGTIGDAPES